MKKPVKQVKFLEEFERIFSYTRTIIDLHGLDVLKDDFKVCWRTIILFFLIHCSVFLCFYGAFVGVVQTGNVLGIFKAGAVVGKGIQGLVKAVTALAFKNELRFIYTQIKEMYEICETKSERYRNVSLFNLSLTKKILTTVFLFVAVLSTMIILMSVYVLVVYKTRTEFLPFPIPFVGTQSDVGYYITTALHVLCIFVATYGNYVSDTWLFVYVSHIPLMKNIIKCNFDDLREILEANPRDSTKSTVLLRDIFKWHQKYFKLTDTIRQTFFWITFATVACEFFGIVCSIICIFLSLWPPATMLTLYLFAMIYSYCFLGNLVEMANDDIITMIYDFNWYDLTGREQKMILIMLRKAQSEQGLSLGGVAPLTMNTALQLTKTLYTFSMMLKEFLTP